MGLFSSIGDILNPTGAGNIGEFLDPAGIFTGAEGVEAATQARELTEQELLRQFDITQENLRPALEAAQAQLPGISRQLDPTQFGSVLQDIRTGGGTGVGLEAFLDPTRQRRSAAGLQQLQLAGLSPGGTLESELGRIDPSMFANLLLGAEQDVFGAGIGLAGLGQGAGGVLSQLGQRTGQQLGQADINAALQSQQAQAAGQQNAAQAAGLAAAFFSDERLKEDIVELGEFKGIRIISWKWKDFVPDRWKDIEIGFSAQDILSKMPQFVREVNGFLAIDRNGLMQHLGVT